MMDPNNHFIKIYRNHGHSYHEMICFEDADQNLCPALEAITIFDQQKVLDLGSGTGRLPMLFPNTNFIGLDLHFHMLREQQSQRSRSQPLVQADMRCLPFPDDEFEVITAGWAIGHFTGWYQENWKIEVAQVLENVFRTLKSGGWFIIIETMTTGSDVPAPPTPLLAAYYNWLETDWGFSRKVIQTDYQFETLEQAARYAKFFFGDELSSRVLKKNWVRLPEWTGIWSKQMGPENQTR